MPAHQQFQRAAHGPRDLQQSRFGSDGHTVKTGGDAKIFPEPGSNFGSQVLALPRARRATASPIHVGAFDLELRDVLNL